MVHRKKEGPCRPLEINQLQTLIHGYTLLEELDCTEVEFM